ncbi:MAG: hypothetical protein COA96_17780 [SAR86 cluster bacterium]|uniref:Peptidase metallopeptidase domain-containing protein n=1 Tax=SAR86 cluster bacterium TaxID=2030880 RepID=A0A2A5ADM1_9GAMM|nr:MAG: hypothetical protein COA96_17780 [SAR86 cluster bacterium]
MRNLGFLIGSILIIYGSNAFETSDNLWENGEAVFHVGISGNSPSGGSWNDAFKRSMDAWSNGTAFQFVAIDDFVDPCIERGAGLFGDNITGVDFSPSVCGTEFGDSVLAVTLTAGTCKNLSCTNGFFISDADIVFNSLENWDIYSGPVINFVSDFERVALHELGHALGLSHSQAGSAIMQSLVSDANSLQADDINGANFIYGDGSETPVETSIATVYGINVVTLEPSSLSGPNDNVSFSGALSSSDAKLDGKFIDLYQYRFENDSIVNIQLSSAAMDPFLHFVRTSSAQDIIPAFTFNDDNSGPGNNASITESIPAGTYWVGVSSAQNGEQGIYDLTMTASSNGAPRLLDIIDSTHGPLVEINPNPVIDGALAQSDFVFQGKFLDLFQFKVNNTTTLRLDLSSNAFDTNLLLVDVLPDKALGNLFISNDDISDSNTNSRIEQSFPPGTYWIGVTSFSNSDTGDYSINISVVIP